MPITNSDIARAQALAPDGLRVRSDGFSLFVYNGHQIGAITKSDELRWRTERVRSGRVVSRTTMVGLGDAILFTAGT